MWVKTTYPDQLDYRGRATQRGLVPTATNTRAATKKYDAAPRCTGWQKCAFTQDRTGDLQIFSLTLSQLSYKGSSGVSRGYRAFRKAFTGTSFKKPWGREVTPRGYLRSGLFVCFCQTENFGPRAHFEGQTLKRRRGKKY